MPIQVTMTGSWFRPQEIAAALVQSPTGELGPEHRKLVEDAERKALREQLHPHGATQGLHWPSNGEQRKAGYPNFLPNRLDGFSKTQKAPMPFPPSLIAEFQESNPALLQVLQSSQGGPFLAPTIESALHYHGEALAKEEAQQAARLAKEEKAPRIFVPSPSPGVTTIFFPLGGPYKDHQEYVSDLAKELRKEYRAILSVPGVDLQIDAPDLAMGRNTASWAGDFYELLPSHVDAINEHGLRLSGAADIVGRVRATADAAELPACDFGIVATTVLAASMARFDLFGGTDFAAALLALIPAFAGLAIGQWLRGHINEDLFRKTLAGVLFLIGLNLIRKALG